MIMISVKVLSHFYTVIVKRNTFFFLINICIFLSYEICDSHHTDEISGGFDQNSALLVYPIMSDIV